FMDGLERGLASHHAGLLPIFKETVEELFAMGLVKAVFATETLSLGINMPARTVVIERLTKFTGEKHEMLTPIEYTQLTGRAGRRGMDELGYGVTLFNPWVQIEKIGQLATQQNYTLRSSFRPSYNMAVNLVRNYDHETATRLLNSSFAQFVADKNVVKWERDLERKEKDASALRRKLRCEAGDVMEYFNLRHTAADATEDRRGSDEVREAITRLAPGDVVVTDRIGRVVVLEPARISSGGAPRFTAMTTDRKLRRLGPRDFREPPAPAAKITLRGQGWRSPKMRKGIARELETLKVKRTSAPMKHSDVKRLVATYENHPVHGCADVTKHMKDAAKLFELDRELSRLHKQVRRRKGTVARTFDRVLAVLNDLGCIEDWQLTGKGELLRRIYNEADLLVVECLARGWLTGLKPEELAAVASAFVYETRRRQPPEVPPTPELVRNDQRIANLFRRLHEVEQEHEVELLKEPDAGFMGQIYEWALGHNLEDVLEDRETSAGDFVRSAK
ncbi:MAG: helicase-related protein, partial [Actinomycetota bacterium]